MRKYIIKEIKDEFQVSKEKAIELAKKGLNETGFFAAIYGKNVKGEKTYFRPIFVDRYTLKKETERALEENPETTLYVLYSKQIHDAPLYEIYNNYKGSADIDIPDEEINEVLKSLLNKTIQNPRLFNRVKEQLLDVYENEIQKYAEEQFYEKGRGRVFEDSDNK